MLQTEPTQTTLLLSVSAKMSQDYSYFGFSYINRNAENDAKNTTALNNAADISVIVVYFLVVLAVGVWVSFAITFKTNFSAIPQ